MGGHTHDVAPVFGVGGEQARSRRCSARSRRSRSLNRSRCSILSLASSAYLCIASLASFRRPRPVAALLPLPEALPRPDLRLCCSLLDPLSQPLCHT